MKFVALLVMLLAFVSCGKDGPQKLAVDKGNAYNQFTANPSCNKVDFTQNYLEQKNLLLFFECLSWSDSYPVLFQKIKNYDKSKWNALFSKFNKGVFNREHVEKFLNYLVKQKSKGRILSLQKAMVDLSEINKIEDLISDFILFLNTHPDYKEKKLLNLNEIQSIFEIIGNISNGLNKVKSGLKNKAKFNKSEFEKDLILFIDQITLSYIGTSFLPLEKLSKFFLGVEDNWIRNRFLEQEPKKTKYVLDFAFNNVARTKKLLTDIGPIVRKEKINCYEGESLFKLDHNAEISSRLLDASNLLHSDFMLSLLDLGQKFTFLKEICRQDKNFEADIEIIENNLNYLFDFVRDDSSFHFFKNLQYSTTNGDENNIVGLTDFLTTTDMELLTNFLYKYLVQDEEYFELLFYGLESMSEETFKKLGLVLQDIVIERSYGIKLLSSFWQGLSLDSKKAFVAIFQTPILSEDANATALLDFINFILENYPKASFDLIQDFGSVFKNSSDLDLFFDFFVEKEVFYELKSLVKNNGILKLIDLLTGKKEKEKILPIEVKFKKEKEQQDDKAASTKCVQEILELNLQGYNYGDIVGMMPHSCNENKENFISKIFQVSSLLKKRIEAGEEFDAFEKGIFSPRFLKIHAALFLSESVRIEFDQKKSFKKQLLDSTDTLEILFDFLEENELLKPILNSLIESFSRQDVASFFLKDKNIEECKDKRKIGGISCRDKEAFSKNMHNLISKLLVDNGEKILLQGLLEAFDPKTGVLIPFESKRQRKHILNLENIIEFLYDHSASIREHEIYYFEKNNEVPQIYSLNLLERLEIVIREIAFSYNYYGAYFVNEVSHAKDYRRRTKRLRLNLKAMSKAMPFFIRMNYVEEDDRRRLLNITNNYSSLYELDNISPKYTKGNYDDLIQSVLALLVQSSAKSMQDLRMMGRPSEEVASKHNVGFITAVVNMSGFSKLAEFLREYIASDKKAFFENAKNKKVLQWLNKELLVSENIEYLKEFLKKIDIKDCEIIWEIIGQLSSKDRDFKESFIKIMGSSLYFMANNELSLSPIIKKLSSFDIKTLKKIDLTVPHSFLEIANDLLVRLANGYKEQIQSLWKGEQLSFFYKRIQKTKPTFSITLLKKKELQSIVLNYQNAIVRSGLNDSDYFYRLFSLLLQKDENNISLLHNMLEILFDENGEQLHEFLEDISKKLIISL